MLPFALETLRLLAIVLPLPAVEDPKASADVVAITLERGSLADGLETYYIGIKLARGWSMYAHPAAARETVKDDAKAGVKTDAKLASTFEMLLDGKKVAFNDIYSFKGRLLKEASGDTYRVYTGYASLTVWMVFDDTKDAAVVSVRMRVVATDGKRRLKESILTAESR
jgi:hypothetical protein